MLHFWAVTARVAIFPVGVRLRRQIEPRLLVVYDVIHDVIVTSFACITPGPSECPSANLFLDDCQSPNSQVLQDRILTHWTQKAT